ncbi:hypothetical protein [Mesorhizobium sp. B2-1-2]|uniref:hypothetical protein n=1 Tax=Mesorhizobium sp. B2-1-2 TaxID=2589973 RepID=UPI00112C1067|nr:hypothetical protein [Mesorhizobium sp. B2-1-2]TPN04513.1 hypothetical protein FJ971_29650 [Mesorhizobium sp. B2-1-2]
MTCIVAIVHQGAVFVGGDSAASDGVAVETRRNAKVFQNGDYLFGYTGSIRVGQQLEYSESLVPLPQGADLVRHLVVHLVPLLRQIAGKEGIDELIVAHGDRLCKIDTEYAVADYPEHAAAGSGEPWAIGNLFDSQGTPETRICRALAAAEANCSGVRAPFTVKSTKGRQS